MAHEYIENKYKAIIYDASGNPSPLVNGNGGIQDFTTPQLALDAAALIAPDADVRIEILQPLAFTVTNIINVI